MRNLTPYLQNKPLACAGVTLILALAMVSARPVMAQTRTGPGDAVEATTVQAAETPEQALFRNLRMEDMVDVLISEGLDYGDSLHSDMIPEMNPEKWRAEVLRIYDRTRLMSELQSKLETSLKDYDLTQLNQFFASRDGQDVVALEIEARKVLSDTDVLQDAASDYETVRKSNPELIKNIDAIIEAGDLVEMNVVGSLNSNMMFYRGLVEGGALDWTDAQLKSEVWGQEADVRKESLNWVRGFSLIAYQPLPDDVLAQYVTLWTSDAGRGLNTALFEAYNALYAEVSHDLGVAIAHYLASQPI